MENLIFDPLVIASLLSLASGAGALFYYTRRRKSDLNKLAQPEPVVEAIQQSQGEVSQRALETVFAPTRDAFWNRLKGLFVQPNTTPQLEEIEEILYTSDLGPKTVQRLMDSVRERLTTKSLGSFEELRAALTEELQRIVSPIHEVFEGKDLFELGQHHPTVWLVVGVNGAGKTTTIGKLAGWASRSGKRVLVAAGDTFRAAAGSQLAVWSQRAQVEIYEAPGKPSGVAFDAVQKALKENFDLVIIDTAGRLHTQTNLMEELKKVKRVIEKALPGAPHETLLVLDANNGQNALVQARQFHEALHVTGVVLTKIDGTAKGGVVVGLAHELALPVRALGVGEKIEDLRPFSASEFVRSIL